MHGFDYDVICQSVLVGDGDQNQHRLVVCALRRLPVLLNVSDALVIHFFDNHAALQPGSGSRAGRID